MTAASSQIAFGMHAYHSRIQNYSFPILDCTEASFDPRWAQFHSRLTAPRLDPMEKDVTAWSKVTEEARFLVRRWYQHASRLCLYYDEGEWFIRYLGGRSTHTSSIHRLMVVRVMTGHLPPSSLEGFCPLGFVAAAAVELGFNIASIREKLVAGDSVETLIQSLSDHADLCDVALKCMGPELSSDFLESSWWPFSSVDLRIKSYMLRQTPWDALSIDDFGLALDRLGNDYARWAADALAVQGAKPFRIGAYIFPRIFVARNDYDLVIGTVSEFHVAVFGHHGSLSAEVPSSLQEAVTPYRLEVQFYGLSWPSRFACEILGKCSVPDNIVLDEWFNNFTFYQNQGFRWSDAAQKSAQIRLDQEFQSDPFLAIIEIVVCTVARLCPLIREVMRKEVPMFAYLSMELAWSSDSMAQDRKILLGMRDVLTDSRNFGAATSPVFAAQVLYQTGCWIPTLRPLARYIGDLSYKGASSNVCLIARSRILTSTAHGVALLYLLEQLVEHIPPYTFAWQGNEWMPFDEISAYRAVLLIPHNPEAMALYDFYALGLPVILPSKRYMLRLLQLRGQSLDLRNSEDYDVSIADQSILNQFTISPMVPPYNINIATYIVELLNFYALPEISMFDSLQEIVAIVRTLDVVKCSSAMQRVQRQHAEQTIAMYRQVIQALLPWTPSLA